MCIQEDIQCGTNCRCQEEEIICRESVFFAAGPADDIKRDNERSPHITLGELDPMDSFIKKPAINRECQYETANCKQEMFFQ